VLKESELKDGPQRRWTLRCGRMRCITAVMFSPVMRPSACSSLPDGKCGSAPHFPIMTMDQHKLTPAMGYVFSPK